MPTLIAGADADLSNLIPTHEWPLYRAVMTKAQARGYPFAIGGGVAFSAYSRRWRNTKDLDLYIEHADLEALKEILNEEGFEDYHSRLPYDRAWIYRGYRDEVIVDFIWQMANYRTQVDSGWLTGGSEIAIHDLSVRLLPPEELLWTKLYVVQRERCDWPDLLNLLFAVGPRLDWDHLLDCLDDDARALGGLLSLYVWMCPAQARELPDSLWKRVGVVPPASGLDCASDRRHVALLDGRDWFGPNQGN